MATSSEPPELRNPAMLSCACHHLQNCLPNLSSQNPRPEASRPLTLHPGRRFASLPVELHFCPCCLLCCAFRNIKYGQIFQAAQSNSELKSFSPGLTPSSSPPNQGTTCPIAAWMVLASAHKVQYIPPSVVHKTIRLGSFLWV